jgi:hypothetical protein
MSGPWILRLMLPAWPRLVPSRTSFGLPRLGCDNLSRPLGDELHIRRVATKPSVRAWDRIAMDGAIMSNHGAAAIEIGTVIAILAGMAIAKQRMPVTQPLSREQLFLSATESQRLSDRQQVNKYFLQNWRDRPTRPNVD